VTGKNFRIFMCFIATIFIASCNAPGTETVILTTSSTSAPTSTTILAPATQTLPTLTQTATTTPVEGESEVPEPALFERSKQELGMRETVQAALGDLDGDGDLDAVFANPMRSNSEVWVNDGSGSLENTGQELTQYGHGVELADFDEDGDLDAFIVCHQFITGSKIYLNDGTGVFSDSGQDLGDAELSGVEIHLIDLNDDGHTDAHVAYYDPAGLPDKVYLNDGTAQFRDSGLALEEDIIAWGDLDLDGDIDYFGKHVGSGYVVQLNNGSGDFTEGWQMRDEETSIGAVALADFDQDGDLDALVTNGYRTTGSFPSRLLWNNGDGTFTDSHQRINDTSGAELAVGDLDLDGDLDIVVSNMDRPNEVWLNTNGQITDSGLQLGDISEISGRPTLGDLDGDGDLDLVMGRFQGGAEIWFNTTISPETLANDNLDSAEINSQLADSTPLTLEEHPRGLIAFSSSVDGDFEIWVMNADGSNLRNLTNNEASDLSPAWSPDGNEIAFVSNRDGNDEIYIINAEGNEVKRLTETKDASESFPSWSPDGEKISFDSNRDGNWEIYVMASDGTDVQRLTYNPAEDWISDWSPDSSQIVFESKRDGNYEIYVMSFDGSEQRRLTNNQVHDGFPAWSPDGKQIAFMSNRDGDYEIYVMNADGSHQRQLTRNSIEDSNPDWSEDGEWLIYVSQTSGNDEIYILKVDNGEVYPITSTGAQNWSPCWQAKP
jgi:WD40 repeat protein